MATAKTNAVSLLDRLGIRYDLRSYHVDPDDLTAETVAQKIGMSPEQVFQTLELATLIAVSANQGKFLVSPITSAGKTVRLGVLPHFL